jgi:NADH-quinone oxidoreductase subunit M
VPLLALMLGIGLYPKPLYDRVNPSVAQVLERVEVALDQRLAMEEGR